jgi:hypothetical protein
VVIEIRKDTDIVLSCTSARGPLPGLDQTNAPVNGRLSGTRPITDPAQRSFSMSDHLAAPRI